MMRMQATEKEARDSGRRFIETVVEKEKKRDGAMRARKVDENRARMKFI